LGQKQQKMGINKTVKRGNMHKTTKHTKFSKISFVFFFDFFFGILRFSHPPTKNTNKQQTKIQKLNEYHSSRKIAKNGIKII